MVQDCADFAMIKHSGAKPENLYKMDPHQQTAGSNKSILIADIYTKVNSVGSSSARSPLLPLKNQEATQQIL